MGTISSTNAGLSNLLQTLSNENSPLLSTLASPAVATALQNAPAADIVQISDQALQLQLTDALFGGDSSSSSPSNSFFSQLEAIYSSAPASANPSTSGASLAEQAAAFQGNSQLQQTDALFGITQPTATNSLFDVLA